jgi:hypothetical protein
MKFSSLNSVANCGARYSFRWWWHSDAELRTDVFVLLNKRSLCSNKHKEMTSTKIFLYSLFYWNNFGQGDCVNLVKLLSDKSKADEKQSSRTAHKYNLLHSSMRYYSREKRLFASRNRLSHCMSARLSACIGVAPTEIWYWGFSWKYVEKMHTWLKQTKVSGTLHENLSMFCYCRRL